MGKVCVGAVKGGGAGMRPGGEGAHTGSEPAPPSPQVAYLISCYMPLDLLNDDMSEGRGHSDDEDDSYSGSDDEGGEDHPASAGGVGKCGGGSVWGRGA